MWTPQGRRPVIVSLGGHDGGLLGQRVGPLLSAITASSKWAAAIRSPVPNACSVSRIMAPTGLWLGAPVQNGDAERPRTHGRGLRGRGRGHEGRLDGQRTRNGHRQAGNEYRQSALRRGTPPGPTVSAGRASGYDCDPLAGGGAAIRAVRDDDRGRQRREKPGPPPDRANLEAGEIDACSSVLSHGGPPWPVADGVPHVTAQTSMNRCWAGSWRRAQQ